MLTGLLIILVILWFIGYVHIGAISIPDVTLFSINNHVVTLWNLLILIVISWAIGILPAPIRAIAGVLLILWILSVLCIIALAGIGLSSLLVLAVILGLVVSVFSAAL